MKGRDDKRFELNANICCVTLVYAYGIRYVIRAVYNKGLADLADVVVPTVQQSQGVNSVLLLLLGTFPLEANAMS